MRFAVGTELNVRQALSMTVARVRGLRTFVHRMLAELAGRQHRWLDLLSGGREQREYERSES
jgi:hypothetical protein